LRVAFASGASAAVVLLALVLGDSALCAQRANPPSLDEILRRLEANLNHHDASVPDIFCDERVVSSQMGPGESDRKTVTDSTFRLRRTLKPDHTITLEESREIKSIDGKPPRSQQLNGPALLNGLFESGLAIVSVNQEACMHYTLQRANANHPAVPYIIRFATVLTPQTLTPQTLTPQTGADCLLNEQSKGRVFIDPVSLEVTRLEIATPRHVIVQGNASTPRVVGKRELTVDYVPVLLGDESFRMPSTITMRTISGSGTFHVIVWSFRATYSNYHRIQVTSRVLPGFAPVP
jgi:hypothetical protein